MNTTISARQAVTKKKAAETAENARAHVRNLADGQLGRLVQVRASVCLALPKTECVAFAAIDLEPARTHADGMLGKSAKTKVNAMQVLW